jgi:hypothetical protein
MPAQVSPRIDDSRSLILVSRYLLGACSVAFAFLSILAGTELSVAPASLDPLAAIEKVNRSGKSNRIPLLPAIDAPVGVRALDQQLFEGCEGPASSLSGSSLARIAVRCLS